IVPCRPAGFVPLSSALQPNARPPLTSFGPTATAAPAAPPLYIHLPLPRTRRGHQPPPRKPSSGSSSCSHPVEEIRAGPPGNQSLAPVPAANSPPRSGPQRRRRARGCVTLLLPLGAMGIGAVSDELLGTFVPIAVYWLYSGLYVALDGVGRLDGYRLHTREEAATKNVVSKAAVVRGVLVQQAFQVAVSLTLFAVIGDESGTGQKQPPALVLALQFIAAMFVMDTWQYFMHRYMHINKFLYKHIHSKHHTLVVPYSFGALYNHPLEGLILDTIGGALSFLVSGMTPRTSIFFFSFATIKTVDDHCGLWLPGNILQALFSNNSAYHDIHHQLYGNKYNFSQPFFVMWDKILGTYMPYSIEQRKGGGVESRPAKFD
ncbi:unnamed protein product, partial [Urochloa humidicola]